jgi:hypothetical protein
VRPFSLAPSGRWAAIASARCLARVSATAEEDSTAVRSTASTGEADERGGAGLPRFGCVRGISSGSESEGEKTVEAPDGSEVKSESVEEDLGLS